MKQLVKHIHLIEKDIMIQQMAIETWALYYASVIGTSMVSNGIGQIPIVVTSKGIKTAGYYHAGSRYRNAYITINAAYWNGDIEDAAGMKGIEETIAHEIAHHITHCMFPNAKQWHGTEFRFVMQAIGYDGNTYHYMNCKDAKQRAAEDAGMLFPL